MRVPTLKPALTSLSPLIGTPREVRDRSSGVRAWYKSKRWKDLSKEVKVRDHYTCQRSDCRKLILVPAHAIAHHRVPHRGDERLFWDINNIETVCKDCHDGPIQAEERRNFIPGIWD